MNMQALIDGMSAQWQRERAQTQITLGKLISELEALPIGAMVANLQSPHSYRGYYSDLSFEMGEGSRHAEDLLKSCRSAMGKVFVGYKGGNYVMGALTPVWVANYGCTGDRLIGLNDDGSFETAPDE